MSVPVPEPVLLHELVWSAAARSAGRPALTYGASTLDYGALAAAVRSCADGLLGLGLARTERVGIYLEKRFETVVASFGAPAAGGVMVPMNPLLKPEQVAYIGRDCDVRVLVTSPERLALLAPVLAQMPALRHVVLTDGRGQVRGQVLTGPDPAAAAPTEVRGQVLTGPDPAAAAPTEARGQVLTGPDPAAAAPTEVRGQVLMGPDPAAAAAAAAPGVTVLSWTELLSAPARAPHRVIDTDLVAILYTSGSTGRPKGVVLSHRNMVAGAKSVASYLENHAGDTLLAALPLSFDAGFSQLTTAFHAGARVVLLNYLLPRDVLRAMEREKVTGLTAVPPLYIQLTQLEWPQAIGEQLRYFANTGGRMPRETLAALRARVPRAKPFLMYGLTEAFRSTYLPPEEVDRRPDSIGRAIPNAEILVLRDDGSECAPDEPGELVHRGALVGQGYWNDPEKTAERYKPLPAGIGGRVAGLQIPEIAVFSGDTVRRDADGFLYFVGRRDEMMKTSGYRVSPTEVEEVLYATKLVGECVAFGVDHPALGQAIQVIATAPDGSDALDRDALLAQCRQHMPAYMVPHGVEAACGPLPRNPNGKIDRKLLATQWLERQG